MGGVLAFCLGGNLDSSDQTKETEEVTRCRAPSNDDSQIVPDVVPPVAVQCSSPITPRFQCKRALARPSLGLFILSHIKHTRQRQRASSSEKSQRPALQLRGFSRLDSFAAGDPGPRADFLVRCQCFGLPSVPPAAGGQLQLQDWSR